MPWPFWSSGLVGGSKVASPVTNVWRDAEVLPQSGVMEVSPERRSNRSIGAPIASAQIWVTIVFEPCPISTAPLCRAILPSGFNPTRIVEGFGREVLPQPYHMPATPTPRRSGPLALALKEAASARAADHLDRKASKQARTPTPSLSTWPVTVGVSSSNAFRIRNSRRSIPI